MPPLRMAVIGVGHLGQAHARVLSTLEDVELVGVAFVPGFDVIDDDNDPTDPLTESGNPGHGTGTASVLVSLESYIVTGSAPKARLMPIRLR